MPSGFKLRIWLAPGPGRHHGQLTTVVGQQPKNVVLDPEIEGHNFEGRRFLFS